MPRTARFTIDNGVYHIYCRGHNRQKIFHSPEDYRKYLRILLESKNNYNLKIHHYTIMSNHVHLIVFAPNGVALSKCMRNVNQKYAQYYRKKYGGIGYLWQDRFKSFIIQDGLYLLECGRYIELNPVKAGIVNLPEEYQWSSYRLYAFCEKNDIVDISPEYFGLADDEHLRAEKYIEFVKDGIKERRGLERYFKSGAYGDKNFVERLKKEGLKEIRLQVGRPKKNG